MDTEFFKAIAPTLVAAMLAVILVYGMIGSRRRENAEGEECRLSSRWYDFIPLLMLIGIGVLVWGVF